MSSLNCLRLVTSNNNLVFINECNEQVHIDVVEVKYYVTGALAARYVREEEQLKRARRLITERIKVDKTIEPGNRLTIYFGVVENIAEVYVEASWKDRRIRVKLM